MRNQPTQTCRAAAWTGHAPGLKAIVLRIVVLTVLLPLAGATAAMAQQPHMGTAIGMTLEHLQRRHYGMKLMAYTLINLRRFCTT